MQELRQRRDNVAKKNKLTKAVVFRWTVEKVVEAEKCKCYTRKRIMLPTKPK